MKRAVVWSVLLDVAVGLSGLIFDTVKSQAFVECRVVNQHLYNQLPLVDVAVVAFIVIMSAINVMIIRKSWARLQPVVKNLVSAGLIAAPIIAEMLYVVSNLSNGLCTIPTPL